MILSDGAIVRDDSGNEFVVGQVLGQGGFGTVYKCQSKDGSTVFALKTLPVAYADSDSLRAFQNDAQTATKLSHPNVIHYHFVHDGRLYSDLPPFIMMEYADGGTLGGAIAQASKTNALFLNDYLVSSFTNLVDGMEAINAQFVHRDVKPDNILIAAGRLKISDFGLAKLVQESTRLLTFKGFGSLPYIAPEAWGSEKNTVQMDIYSMGIVFYQLASLRHPLAVSSGDPAMWRDAHLFQAPANPSSLNPGLTPTLATAILRMIAKKTSDRFASWEAIREFLSNERKMPEADADLIQTALHRRFEADAVEQSKEAEAQRKQSERETFLRAVESQYVNEVIEPLRPFLHDFNSRYQKRNATLTPETGKLSRQHILQAPGGRVEFRIEPLLDEAFMREREVRDVYGTSARRTQLVRPHLKGRKILAWGYVRGYDHKGFNLLLLERPTDIYGDWILLFNKMGWPADVQPRPEPFAFDFDELEEEVGNVGAMHIYATNVLALEEKLLKEFVANYF